MDRWIAGTRHLTYEQKGFYLDLLIWMYETGNGVKDAEHAARILDCDPRTSRRLLADLRPKFYERSGELRNKLVTELIRNGGKIRGLRAEVESTEFPDVPDPVPVPVKRSPDPSQESGSGGFAEFQSPPIHDLSREPPSGGICKGAFRENAPGAKPPKAGPKANGYAPDFEALWNAKPRRAGADDKRRAYRAWSARRTEGHEPATMLEGTIRYRAYCQAQDKEGTEYVMQTATFLGPSDPPHFLNRWDPPKPRAAEGNYERLARHFGWDQEGVTLEGEVDNGDNHEA